VSIAVAIPFKHMASPDVAPSNSPSHFVANMVAFPFAVLHFTILVLKWWLSI